MNDVLIRKATPADADAVKVLFQEELSFFGYLPNNDLDSDILRFPDTYSNGTFMLAEWQMTAIGMGGLLNGELRRIYIRQDFRAKGIGSKIMRALLEKHRGEVTAVVRKENAPMIGMLTKFGFSYYSDHPRWVFCAIYKKAP